MKRALQATIAVLSLLPLAFGAFGLLMGAGMYIRPELASPKLDSQFRFMLERKIAPARVCAGAGECLTTGGRC